MRTDAEILAQIEDLKNNDFFGFATGDLIGFLPFEAARPYLKPEVTADQWTAQGRDKQSLLAAMKGYMDFAWEKANDCRGLSAGRSINHMEVWLWMLGEDEASKGLDDYSHYGKPQLRAICEHYGWDWRAWDDGRWSNSEGDAGGPPEDVESIQLKWAPTTS